MLHVTPVPLLGISTLLLLQLFNIFVSELVTIGSLYCAFFVSLRCGVSGVLCRSVPGSRESGLPTRYQRQHQRHGASSLTGITGKHPRIWSCCCVIFGMFIPTRQSAVNNNE